MQSKSDRPKTVADEHARTLKWFESYVDATTDARALAAKARDYYDGKQWSDEEIEKLGERNQPPTVVNRIFKKVNYLIGLEISARSDPKALPRTPSHEQDADAITDALRYVADVEGFDKISSDAWENKLIEGVAAGVVEIEEKPATGAMRGAASVDPAQDESDYTIKLRFVPHDRFFFDPHSRDRDFSDARFLGISTWMDLEEAVDYWASRPDAAENTEEILRTSMQYGATDEAHADRPSSWSDTENKRVRWIETYYRVDGKWHVCFAAKAGFLVRPKPTEYLDDTGNDTCPLVADSAFVASDNARYGLVRHMLDIQDELNKRRSKALHWMSVDRFVYEEGALDNPDEAQAQWAKPDGAIKLAPDALARSRWQAVDGAGKAQQQYQMLGQSNAEIDSVGPDAPQIASTPGSSSGRALMMRQQIGNLEIAKLIDGHGRWKRRIMTQAWYRIRQFWTGEKHLRVRDDLEQYGYRFVRLNKKTTRGERLLALLDKGVPVDTSLSAAGVPRPRMDEAIQIAAQQAQQMGAQPSQEQIQQMAIGLLLKHPLMDEEIREADTAQIGADVVIDESPDTSILQFEEFEAYMQTLPTLLNTDPQNAKQYLAIGLEMSGSRFKKKVLALLQQPPAPPDPQQAQFAQMSQQIQIAMLQAQLTQIQARAQREQAETAKTIAEANTAVPAAATLDSAQAAKASAEAQLLVPAKAHEAQSSGDARQVTAPARAWADHSLARHRADHAGHDDEGGGRGQPGAAKIAIVIPAGPQGQAAGGTCGCGCHAQAPACPCGCPDGAMMDGCRCGCHAAMLMG